MEPSEMILEYVKTNGQVTAKQALESLKLPRSSFFRELKKLTKEGKLYKSGTHPNFVYTVTPLTAAVNVPQGSAAQAPAAVLDHSTDTWLAEGVLVNWCKILALQPEAVFDTYAKIHSFFPTYQSLGLAAPRAKKGQIKIPKSIWTKLFNLSVWLVAALWNVLKKMPRPVLIMVGLLLIGGFIFQKVQQMTSVQKQKEVKSVEEQIDKQLISSLSSQLRKAQQDQAEAQQRFEGSRQSLAQLQNELASTKESAQQQWARDEEQKKNSQGQIAQVRKEKEAIEHQLQQEGLKEKQLQAIIEQLNNEVAAKAQVLSARDQQIQALQEKIKQGEAQVPLVR